MGLSLSPGGASWSYSGYMDFRIRLAKEIGINLAEMEGFEILGKHSGVETIKSWENVNDDIKILLVHSDCDGIMKHKKCAKVLPRLRQLISKWDDNDYDKQQALKLISGMEKCVRKKINLEFI